MSTSEKVKEAVEAAKEAVDRAADKSHEFAERTRAKTHAFVDHTRDKAHHAADDIKDKAHAAPGAVRQRGRRIPPLVWAALALLLVGASAFFLGRGTAKKSAPVAAKAPASPAPPPGPPTIALDPQQLQYADVALSKAPRLTLPTKLSTLGSVAANLNHQAPVMARLSGKVTQVTANVGQTVQAGQTLLVVSSPDLFQAQAAFRDAELRRTAARAALLRLRRLAGLGQYSQPLLAQARTAFAQGQGEVQANKDAVNVAQAQARQAQAQVDLTARQLVRDQALFDALLLSRQDLEQAQANAAQAVAARDAALSALRQATDRQVNAQKRAQIAGRALSRQTRLAGSGALNAEQVGPAYSAYVQAAHEVEASAANVRLLGGVPMDESDPGGGMLQVTAPIAGTVSDRMVAVGENVTPDKPLLTLLNLNSVVVQLSVYQEDLPHVRVGQRVRIASDTAPGRAFYGLVSVVSAALDPSTRTASVSCLIQNPQGLLRPGVYVSGTIYGASRQNAVAVPENAVQQVGGGSVVFTPTGKAGEFAATPVKTGETDNGLTQVVSGLAPGQPYVSKNAFVLKSQMIKDTLD